MSERYYTEGSVPQIGMERNSAVTDTERFNFPCRGIVKKVYLKDDPANNTGETVVDIALLDGFPPVYKVPLQYQDIDATEGEERTPIEGHIAVVQFIAGKKSLPIVTGFLAPPKQELTATTAQAPRSHRKKNGTSEIIQKDGTRKIKVALSELMEVTQDWLVDVINGITTIVSKGKITLKSEGTIDLDGLDTGAVKGCVQLDSICPLLKAPHIHGSASVKASK
jgi:hypothetical protein